MTLRGPSEMMAEGRCFARKRIRSRKRVQEIFG